MKRLFMIIMCIAAMMAAGTSLKAQEVTIVLNPGWTWISYPSTDTVDIATAFGSFTPAIGDIFKSKWGMATYIGNGQWRGAISPVFYPGYGYHYKSNRPMPVVVTVNVQQPAPQVVVTTSEPMLITAISAMGGGEVTVNDGTYIIVKGLCWATHENPTTNDDFYQEAESGVGSFSVSMTDLNINTTYYVRAYTVTANGTIYGDQKVFTTRDGIPTLTTIDITNITGVGAKSGGNITDNGGLNVTARGVCWSTSHNPNINDNHSTNGTGTGSFISSITGLEVNTNYYVRAYAITNAGTAYGNEVSFITRDGIPTLTTADITNITALSATSGGSITDNGGLNITARGVCWSMNPNPTTNENHTTNNSGSSSFTSSITGLDVNTTYYVRAYATTNAGTAYGNELSFTTDSLPTGAIAGLFSVSYNSQVYFSQGNLQYIGSAAIPYWKFAENQWDCLGNTTGQNSSNSNVDRDLFGWGTSGWNNGNVYYHPWDTNKSNGSLYGPIGQYDLTGSYANADWGIYNSISNGGNTSNTWRTLTSLEWDYVFNTRITVSNIRYAKAQVNGVNGVILLPDDWNVATYNLSNTNSPTASFNCNVIDVSQWTILEIAGAVFLPAAGVRTEISVNYVGSYGMYWTASCYTNYHAYYVYMDVSFLSNYVGDHRGYGRSVRLVSNAE